MKNYRMFALKELSAQRVTSLLILLAVILSTMMTAVIGRSAGILAAMRRQQAAAIGGSKYATFVQMNKEQIDTLQKDPRLSYVGVTVTLGTAELNRALTLRLNEYRGDALDVYPSVSKIKEGRLPQAPLEIALPEDALQYLGFSGKIGDSVTLTLSKALRHGVETSSYQFTADFTLTGITESSYLNYAAGRVQGIVGPGTAEALLPENYLYYNADIRTVEKGTFQETVNDLISALQIHELDTLYNTVYLDAMGIRHDAEASDITVSDEGFSFLLAAGIMICVLLLSAAGLVIYNILKIAVSRRIKQYGILRAIGAKKGQLYYLVTAQVLLLCLIGIPIGLLLGALSAKGILSAATDFFSPEVFLVQDSAELKQLIAENSSGNWGFLLLSAVVTLTFALTAALPAARFAAKVSPVTAISGTNIRIKRKKRIVRRIRNFERYYAWLNLKRNKGRSAVTMLSLMMSITVFIALQESIPLLNAAGKTGDHLGDYSIINEITGFSGDDLKAMEADDRVTSVAAIQFSLYPSNEKNMPEGISLGFDLKPGETFQMVGLNAAYWDHFFGETMSDADLELLKSGAGCVVRNPIPLIINGEEAARTDLKAGSTITVAGKELPVLKTLNGYDGYFSVGNSGFTNGVQVIVDHTLYPELTGKSGYNELFPKLKTNAERAAYDRTIEELAERIPGTTYLSYEKTDKQLAESFEQIRFLTWGLILFVSFIGILNIINTVYTNIHIRVTEIGMQRAIGMSASGLYKTFLWEGAYYGIFASLFGGVLSYLCILLINAAETGGLTIMPVPFLSIAEASILAIAACLLATAVPLRSISRRSIVNSIETVE